MTAPTQPTPPANDPVAKMVEVLRTRAWLRRGLSFLSFALLIGAVGMLGYPFFTNVWADRIQNDLANQIQTEQLRADYEAALAGQVGAVAVGDALTRITIPAINISTVVVEGTTANSLRAGAGHYPNTPLPCQTGNVAIAGHRTTYGRPFHNLDLLSVGDEITLETPVGSCTYEIMEAPVGQGAAGYIVAPEATEVVAPPTAGQPGSMLTLTTCHPKGSAKERLIVHAQLVSGAGATA